MRSCKIAEANLLRGNLVYVTGFTGKTSSSSKEKCIDTHSINYVSLATLVYASGRDVTQSMVSTPRPPGEEDGKD